MVTTPIVGRRFAFPTYQRWKPYQTAILQHIPLKIAVFIDLPGMPPADRLWTRLPDRPQKSTATVRP